MNIQWKILGLRNRPLPDGSSDVVEWIQWSCYGQTVVDNVGWFAHQEMGEISQIVTNGGPFIPYVDVTEADILNWVWNSGVDKTQVEALVADAINQQIAQIP